MEKIRIIQAVVVILFIITVYFFLPYILPIVGIKPYLVISGSMSHPEGNQTFFESFFKNMSIEPETLPLRYGFHQGDLIITTPSESYNLGDVVALKIPESQTIIIHRIYRLNSTHFRDIGDNCISEEKFRTVTLGAKDFDILLLNIDKEEITPEIEKKYKKIYEGPHYEMCSHYWMPISSIQGKVALLLPQAGFLDLVLKGYR